MPYYDFPHNLTHYAIVDSVLNGTLSEAVVDERVADLVRVKMELGKWQRRRHFRKSEARFLCALIIPSFRR